MSFDTDDLPVFFALKEDGGFADAATLQGGEADGEAVIFDREYLEQLGIAGTQPMALGMASRFAASDVDKTLTISGTAYTIKGCEPVDDGALVRLTLKL
jgi:hypothetical protein